MVKLTRSLPMIRERNCFVSMALDTRSNISSKQYLLSVRFTIDRRSFYYHVGGAYTVKQFSDICNASKSSSSNYKEQKEWWDIYGGKYKNLLQNLNKGGILTYEMVRKAVTAGNSAVWEEKDDKSFFGIWEEIIHELRTKDNGARYSTSENYQSALKSFKKIMGDDSIKGFNISAAEIQKWKDGMHSGVPGPDGKIIGKTSDTTIGIYLRVCRAVWNACLRKGFLQDVPYPFSNRREKGMVSIPMGAKRRQSYLNVNQMTQLYEVFRSKNYPKEWDPEYTKKAHYSLGLFLAQYLCNGFNLADAGRLTYDTYYYQNEQKAFRFNRKKTLNTSQEGSEVIVPIIEPLQYILSEIAAEPTRGGYVFPDILKGEESEKERRKRTSQENANIKDRVRKICIEVLHWDEAITPSGTWCRHSFATNLRNAGVDLDYISESMGHSSTDHAITQIYIEHYPLETQMKYNSKLLNLETSDKTKEDLIAKLADLSKEELIEILAKRNIL